MRGDQHVLVIGPHVEVRCAGTERPCLIEDLYVRLSEFGAHDPGDCAADHARDDRENQVECADVLVVRRLELAGEEARLVVRVEVRVTGLVQLEGKCVGGSGAHFILSPVGNHCALRTVHSANH